jgi:hypothetical protein
MPLSYTQRKVIEKIVEALEEFLTRHEFTTYDDEPELFIRLNSIANELQKEIRPILDNLITDCLELERQSQEFEKRIHNLENIIRPDETDVYNINRRIELLAQRIAILENKKRGG